jgi:hypothetical protein
MAPSPADAAAAAAAAAPQAKAERKSGGSSGSKRKRVRKGKWTTEEEEYANKIIHYFGSGLLDISEGTTLRAHVAEALDCDPMRITKKFTGASRIGKKTYRKSEDGDAAAKRAAAAVELKTFSQRFNMRLQREEDKDRLTILDDEFIRAEQTRAGDSGSGSGGAASADPRASAAGAAAAAGGDAGAAAAGDAAGGDSGPGDVFGATSNMVLPQLVSNNFSAAQMMNQYRNHLAACSAHYSQHPGADFQRGAAQLAFSTSWDQQQQGK